MRIGTASLLLLGAACAGLPPGRRLEVRTPTAAKAALERASEAFYGGTDVATLEGAVALARQAAPDSARYHELAAQWASLSDRPHERFEHLLAALTDRADDAPLLHLQQIEDPNLSAREGRELETVVAELSAHHPDPAVRALAASMRATYAHLRGDDDARDQAMGAISGHLPLSVVGVFDNDQGKGFHTVYEPEKRVNLGATYDGAVLRVGWRSRLPTDYTRIADLSQLLNPVSWNLAYAAAGFRLNAAGSYELRLATTDPLKVWVDDTLVFEAERVEGFLLDQFVLPLELHPGAHRVLIKSAHRNGAWALEARLTGAEGVVIAGLQSAAADGVVAAPMGHAPPQSLEAVLERHLEHLPAGSVRAAYVRSRWAELLLDGDRASPFADAYLAKAPGAVMSRLRLVQTLWSTEAGRAGDVLASLDAQTGGVLPLIRVLQAQRWQQQGLRQRARDALMVAAKAHHGSPLATRALTSLFAEEGWLEDRCRLRRALASQADPGVSDVVESAGCESALGFDARAEKTYREVLEVWPRYRPALGRLARLLEERGATEAAEDALHRLVEAFPTERAAYLSLAEVEHRRGRNQAAEQSIQAALALCPDAAEPWDARARYAYQAGRSTAAVAGWQKALARNPKEERLANRLDFLAPASVEAWSADVPDERALSKAVETRATVKPGPGANTVLLLDEEVVSVKADGSTASVTTQVAHILSVDGRDRYTHLNLGGRGRTRILHAYAVDPDGQRVDAASTTGNVIRFRKLEVGTTVVLQYRRDAGPEGFLSSAFVQQWNAQEANAHYAESRFILWTAATTPLHEQQVGAFEREEKKVGSLRRVSWTAREVPPLLKEPAMPQVTEVLRHLYISTVPDWDVFARWQAAVLEGVFRSSPELDALATRLFVPVSGDVATADEKLSRIQEFIENNFRYEIETSPYISEWRPHPAPVVLEHRYGDCKDRAVLFYALAARAGIHVEFAILNTRGSGLVTDPALPMPRFNHAIVYVPAQTGVAAARFMDPTTEGLDLDVLRSDDPGVTAFTYDPLTQGFSWHEIPFQSPDQNEGTVTTKMRLDREGTVEGTFAYSGRGTAGQWVRVGARQPVNFSKRVQQLVTELVPGSTAATASLGEVTSLRAPATLETTFHSSTAVRKDRESLRMRLPFMGSPEHSFSLATRHFPLVAGAPSRWRYHSEIVLPEGTYAAQLPSEAKVEGPCFQYARTVQAREQTVTATQSLTWTCARVEVAQYPEHRLLAQRIAQLLEEDVVIAPLLRQSARRSPAKSGPLHPAAVPAGAP